jgi:hypothetical protein
MGAADSCKTLVPDYQTTHVTDENTIISVRNFSCLVEFTIFLIRVEISLIKEAVSYSEDQKCFSTHKMLYTFNISKVLCSFYLQHIKCFINSISARFCIHFITLKHGQQNIISAESTKNNIPVY